MSAVFANSAGSIVLEQAEADGYPRFKEFLPPAVIDSSHYRVCFAANAGDLEAVQRLRYRVFNVELGEGLDGAHASGRDEDPFDHACHHLMVVSHADQRVVGTYRMQTSAMARAGQGFYADQLFDLGALPPALREQAMETGRACIAAGHRNGRVLFLLWHGLALYLKHNRLRYLFGCSSLNSQDPAEGLALHAWLARAGHLHEHIRLRPRPGHACAGGPSIGRLGLRTDPPAAPPQLMRLYLEYGAKVCGGPAIDRDFKTIDFFTLLDVDRFDARTRKKFFG